MTIAVVPDRADACSAPACWPGVLSPNAGTVPANLPGIYWRPLSGSDTATDPNNVVLGTAAAPDTPLAFTTTPLADGAFVLVPSQPLEEGTTYVVTDHNTCDGFVGGPSTTFQVGADAALPIALGSLSITTDAIETFDVGTSSGSCSATVTGHRVTITPQLLFEATPWSDVFHFETLVDGQLWQRSTSINTLASVRGTWALYRTCESSDPGAATGLAAGPHTVVVRATIPGSSVVLESDPLTVDLHCPGEPGGIDDSAGCQASGSAGAPWFVLAALLGISRLRRRRRRS